MTIEVVALRRLVSDLTLRVDALEERLAHVAAMADRAVLHSVPFGAVRESPGPLMPDEPKPLPWTGPPRIPLIGEGS